jgi:hypothetical protein
MSDTFSKVSRPILFGWSVIVAIALVSIFFNLAALGMKAPFWGVMLFVALISAHTGALRSRDFLNVWGLIGLAFVIVHIIASNMGLYEDFPMANNFLAGFPILGAIFSFVAFEEDSATRSLLKQEREERKCG